jgi:formylglycine-generating enzyme required for sulfatase activity
VHELAGNVWEWCLNDHDKPERVEIGGDASRVLRGGSWDYDARYLRAAFRFVDHPDFRYGYVGFRVCRGSPIEPLATGALDAGSLGR